MTPTAYWERKARRLYRRLEAEYSPNLHIRAMRAKLELIKHVRENIAPSVTDTVWRSKRDGGPYRLDFSGAQHPTLAEQRASQDRALPAEAA